MGKLLSLQAMKRGPCKHREKVFHVPLHALPINEAQAAKDHVWLGDQKRAKSGEDREVGARELGNA